MCSFCGKLKAFLSINSQDANQKLEIDLSNEVKKGEEVPEKK